MQRSSAHILDLDGYFARIGYHGSAAPTLATLNALIMAHVVSVPFENLDVLLRRPIDLSAQALENKLVRAKRGGYCFEQNGFFLTVLDALGFAATPLSARVRYQKPRDFIPPRTHLFSRVELEGESWLADVGVGGVSPTSALRLMTDEEQETPHEARRIVREGALLFHQVRFGSDWHDVYEFTLEEMPPIDREVANWFTSAHPESHFKNRLIVARALADGGRKTLVNRELTWRRRGGESDTRSIASPEELLTVLAADFGLTFPPGTEFPCPGLAWDAPGASRGTSGAR